VFYALKLPTFNLIYRLITLQFIVKNEEVNNKFNKFM